MARAFEAKRDPRVTLIRRSWIDDDGAWVIWAKPLKTETETGTSTSSGFPALILTNVADDAEAIAKRIAEVLTEAGL